MTQNISEKIDLVIKYYWNTSKFFQYEKLFEKKPERYDENYIFEKWQSFDHLWAALSQGHKEKYVQNAIDHYCK
jgi:hypothetical protein